MTFGNKETQAHRPSPIRHLFDSPLYGGTRSRSVATCMPGTCGQSWKQVSYRIPKCLTLWLSSACHLSGISVFKFLEYVGVTHLPISYFSFVKNDQTDQTDQTALVTNPRYPMDCMPSVGATWQTLQFLPNTHPIAVYSYCASSIHRGAPSLSVAALLCGTIRLTNRHWKNRH